MPQNMVHTVVYKRARYIMIMIIKVFYYTGFSSSMLTFISYSRNATKQFWRKTYVNRHRQNHRISTSFQKAIHLFTLVQPFGFIVLLPFSPYRYPHLLDGGGISFYIFFPLTCRSWQVLGKPINHHSKFANIDAHKKYECPIQSPPHAHAITNDLNFIAKE